MRIIGVFIGITTAIIINYTSLTNFDKVSGMVDSAFEDIVERLND